MIYTNLNGKLVSMLGAGTLHLPTDGECIDVNETTRFVDCLMENGVTYYDLGHSYFNGQAEDAIQKALVMRYPRERYYLTNKLHVSDIRSEADSLFESQLIACGASYFDMYLVHGITDGLWEEIEEKRIFSLLREKKEEGKVGVLGASFHTSFELFEYIINKYQDILEFVQLPLSYFNMARTDVKKQYALAHEKGLPVVVMSPLMGGTLSCGGNNKADAMLSEVKEKYSVNAYDLGLLYASSLAGVVCVLSGISSLSQAKHNAALMEKEIKLTESEMKLLERASWCFAGDEDNKILCLDCNYCKVCPSKIKIPRIFEAYNKFLAKSSDPFSEVKQLAEAEKLIPAKCLGCEKCEEICPEHLSITSFIERLGYRKNEREDYTADA